MILNQEKYFSFLEFCKAIVTKRIYDLDNKMNLNGFALSPQRNESNLSFFPSRPLDNSSLFSLYLHTRLQKKNFALPFDSSQTNTYPRRNFFFFDGQAQSLPISDVSPLPFFLFLEWPATVHKNRNLHSF